MQRFKVPGLFVLAFGLIYAFVFDSKLDMGGDNAGYIILGQALLQGEGYTNIHIPGSPPRVIFLRVIPPFWRWLWFLARVLPG